MAILGCDPVFVDKNKIGKLVKEEMIVKNDINILVQAYTIPSYDQERTLMYWCKSKNTKDVQTQAVYDRTNVKIVGDGWKRFSLGSIHNLENKTSLIKNLAIDRVNVIDDNFIYIDRGMTDFAVSFDACADIKNIFISAKISDNLTEKSDRLFKSSELSIYFKTDADGLVLASFSGHTHQIINGSKQYCFNINKVWVVDSNNQYQVCTEDKGKSWFATRKIGEGKVMKRLAGSEEWINFAI